MFKRIELTEEQIAAIAGMRIRIQSEQMKLVGAMELIIQQARAGDVAGGWTVSADGRALEPAVSLPQGGPEAQIHK
mgnify:CR=1 FL=1